MCHLAPPHLSLSSPRPSFIFLVTLCTILYNMLCYLLSMHIEFLFKTKSLRTTDFFISIFPPLAHNNIFGIELGLDVILWSDYINVKCSHLLLICLDFSFSMHATASSFLAWPLFLILSKSHVFCIICSNIPIHGELSLL